MQVIGGVLLLLAAALLGYIMNLTWLLPLLLLVVLVGAGLALIFGADDKAKALAAKWWGALRTWAGGHGGWPLWEAIALGLIVFGLFAGPDFLAQPLIYLGAFLAPWLAGLWAGKRDVKFPPGLFSAIAGAIVGIVEGVYFFPLIPADWGLSNLAAKLILGLLGCIIGGGLGFWAFARGRIKLTK